MKLKLLALTCAVATASFVMPQALAETNYTQATSTVAALSQSQPLPSSSGQVILGYQGTSFDNGEDSSSAYSGLLLEGAAGVPVVKTVLGELSVGGELGYSFPIQRNEGGYKTSVSLLNAGIYLGTVYKVNPSFAVTSKLGVGYLRTTFSSQSMLEVPSVDFNGNSAYLSVSLGGVSFDHFTYGLRSVLTSGTDFKHDQANGRTTTIPAQRTPSCMAATGMRHPRED